MWAKDALRVESRREQGLAAISGRSSLCIASHKLGRVMVGINDHPDIREVFQGFHIKELDIGYTMTNQRIGKSEVVGELVVMNWQPSLMGMLF
ncbi:prophage adenine modification methytransferase [Pseudomonas sp. StFLB209]|nr:prophage adenine modification methytransferase [Pseudomonas sp. StFLB209]